jgi:hypothetical protein
LGNPPPNGIKFFAIVDILERTKDRSWLVKITSAIHQHWHKQNAAKRICPHNGSVNGHSSLLDLPVAAAAR